jgi:hypothetical protein
MEGASLFSLTGEAAGEAHGLGEGAAVAERGERGREAGVERGPLAAEYRGREERRRPDVPGEFRQASAVPDGELPGPGRGRPAQRQVTARLEPAGDPGGDQVAVEPVERVPDDGVIHDSH